jgi:hypothetical protein
MHVKSFHIDVNGTFPTRFHWSRGQCQKCLPRLLPMAERGQQSPLIIILLRTLGTLIIFSAFNNLDKTLMASWIFVFPGVEKRIQLEVIDDHAGTALNDGSGHHQRPWGHRSQGEFWILWFYSWMHNYKW